MCDLLVVLDELAESYISEKEAHAESNRLTMLLAGGSGGYGGSKAEQDNGNGNRRAKSKAACWAWARGKCSRGAEACRFTHYGESGGGKSKAPEGSQSATLCPSVSTGAVFSGEVGGRALYSDVLKGTAALTAGLTEHSSTSRVDTEGDRVTAMKAVGGSVTTLEAQGSVVDCLGQPYLKVAETRIGPDNANLKVSEKRIVRFCMSENIIGVPGENSTANTSEQPTD